MSGWNFCDLQKWKQRVIVYKNLVNLIIYKNLVQHALMVVILIPPDATACG